MRGEYLEFTDSTKLREGLPPHTWGIHFNFSAVRFCDGITPTHVGNTKSLKNSNEQLEDYPHTRGEYSLGTVGKPFQLGLPPHTWGIH